jgi:hypothetical protein
MFSKLIVLFTGLYMENLAERRRSGLLREVLIPIVVAIVVGIGSSYMTSRVAIAVLQKEIEFVRDDLSIMQQLVSIVSSNQVQLAARGEWMKNADKERSNLRVTVDAIVQSSYTKSDAKKDNDQIIREIKLRHEDRVY